MRDARCDALPARHAGADRSVHATTARAIRREAALDALARIAHPSSVPLFTAQLASKSGGLSRHRDRGARAAGDARRSCRRFRRVVDKDHESSVTLAGAFAMVMLGNTPTDRVSDWLGRPALREQAKRYLVEIAPRRTATFSHQLLDSDPQIRAGHVRCPRAGRGCGGDSGARAAAAGPGAAGIARCRAGDRSVT